MNDNLNLKKKLSKLIFDVTKTALLKERLVENSTTFLRMEPTTAYVAKKLFSSNHKFLSKSGY